MVRKFQLQPLWRPGMAAIDLPDQPRSETDNPTIKLGMEFFLAFPSVSQSFSASEAPKLAVQIRYIVPFDAIQAGKSGAAIDSAYKLDLTNLGSTSLLISPPPERQAMLIAPVVLASGQSASVAVGSTIGWSQSGYSTTLILSPATLNTPTPPSDVKPTSSVTAYLPPSAPPSQHQMDIDPVARTYVQGFSTRAPAPTAAPILQLEKKIEPAVERNPLKEPVALPPPNDHIVRPVPEWQTVKMKSDPTSPRGVVSPRSANSAFRETPSSLKSRMPQTLSDLNPSISPRNSISSGMPVPPSSPRHTVPAHPTESMMGNSGLQGIHARHTAEMEALLMKQQLDVVNLVTYQKMELDAFVRGVPVMPPSQIVNLGILGVFNTLTKLQTMIQHRELTGSGEIDIVSVDDHSTDPNTWKTTAGGYGAAPSPSRAKKSGRKKDSHSHSPAALGSSPSPSAPGNNHHAHHQHNQRSAAAESSSEDDGLRRTHRKRKTPSQPDYFVEDRELDLVLAGKKKRAEAQQQSPDPFPVPVPVTTASPLAAAVPFKKPKPRDNVSIATILDIYSPLKSSLPNWKFVTGDKTLILYHKDCLDHITPEWHLESPNRLKAVMESIALVQERYPQFCDVVSDFSPAALDIVRQIHEESYLKKIQNKIPVNRAMPPLHATQDIELSLSMSASLATPTITADPACEPPKDTYVSFGSWNAALLAAGSVIVAIDRLFQDPSPNQPLRNAFCGVRPPGHHAGSHGHDGASTNGYCVLNSVAIGAQHAINTYKLNRIAILDFDVHQGNGTAQIVEKDPRILFVSLHGSEIYPFSESTKAEADKCTDRIINIGYPNGTNGKQFMELFVNRCKQVLIDFNPELILLSAGFDAHIDDPTGAAMLRFADYVALTRIVKEIADTPACKGRIVSVLEGGYDIRALKLSVTAHILALMEGGPVHRNGNERMLAITPPSVPSAPLALAPAPSASPSANTTPNATQTSVSMVSSTSSVSSVSNNAMAVDSKSVQSSAPSSGPDTPSSAANNSV